MSVLDQSFTNFVSFTTHVQNFERFVQKNSKVPIILIVTVYKDF